MTLGVSVFHGSISDIGQFFLSTATWIIILPVALHVIDKFIIEKISPVRESLLRGRMEGSPQEPVRVTAETDANFAAVKAYFEFDRRCHFISSVTIFNVVSLYIFQVECTHRWLCFELLPLLEIISLLGFLFTFLLALVGRRIDPAQANPRSTLRWELAAILGFVTVISTELGFRLGTNTCQAEVLSHDKAISTDTIERDVQLAVSQSENAQRLAAQGNVAADRASAVAEKALQMIDATRVVFKEVTRQLSQVGEQLHLTNDRVGVLETRVDRPLSRVEWKEIQEKPAARDFKVRIDGIKGGETCIAIRHYQQQLGSLETGVLGPGQISGLLGNLSVPKDMRPVDQQPCP